MPFSTHLQSQSPYRWSVNRFDATATLATSYTDHIVERLNNWFPKWSIELNAKFPKCLPFRPDLNNNLTIDYHDIDMRRRGKCNLSSIRTIYEQSIALPKDAYETL